MGVRQDQLVIRVQDECMCGCFIGKTDIYLLRYIRFVSSR